MMPPAPLLFSITIGWPSSLDSGSISRRAVRSTPPPGGKGTMILIGRSGNLPCAQAARATNGAATAAANRLLRVLRKATPSAPRGKLDSHGMVIQHLTNKLSDNQKVNPDEENLSRRLPLRCRPVRMRDRSDRSHEQVQLLGLRQGTILEGHCAERFVPPADGW